jgi:hypothetical protein
MYDNGMSSQDVVIIQVVNGSDAGGVPRAGLSDAQRAGRACVMCFRTDEPTVPVGWVDGHPVLVHSWCVSAWRFGGRNV